MSENEMTQAEANLQANPKTAKQIYDFLKDPSTGVVYEGRHAADAVNSDANDDDVDVEDEEVNDGDIFGTGEDDDDEEDDEDEDEEDEDDDEDDAEYERKDIENF
jgi:hypothetical protein